MGGQDGAGPSGPARPWRDGPVPVMRPHALALPIPLPYPPELPAGLRGRPRVLQLVDTDAISHGLVDGTPRERASNQEVRACLELVRATAAAVDPQSRIVCAASSATATHHLDVMTASGGNTFVIRRGIDGADQALLEELRHLTAVHLAAHRPRRRRPADPADLVILVAQDHIFAPAIRQLRLLGVPTWLFVPGQRVAAELYTAACAVTSIGPLPGRLNTGGTGRRPSGRKND
jgi:hypothetical protein